MDEKLRSILSEALEVAPEEIAETASQETLAAWTSLAHLRLVTEIESAFDVRFSMDEVVELTSVPKLVARLGLE